MKKFLIAIAVLVFSSALFTSEVKAQIPFIDQSLEQIVTYSGYSTTRPDGTVDWTLYIDHYGIPMTKTGGGLTTGYCVWETHTLYKYVSGSWVKINTLSDFDTWYGNASSTSPNRTIKTVWSHDIIVEAGCGPGVYKSVFEFIAYDPVYGTKFPMITNWVVFNVYAGQ